MSLDPKLIREVSQKIEDTIKANRRSELVIIILLIMICVVGLGLILYGIVKGNWTLIIPGGAFDILVIFPIQKIIVLRGNDMKLRYFPILLSLADAEEAKVIVAELLRKLLEDLSL